MLLDALKALFTSIARLCGLMVAWVLKGAGSLVLFLSKQLFKISGK